jgi:hypothetical protein
MQATIQYFGVLLTSRVLRIRIRDPGLGAFLTPGSGVGESRHPDPGSGMNNPDHFFKSLETILLLFWGLKYLNSLMRIRDPGWRQFGSGIRDGKKSDPGSGINIPDLPHWIFIALPKFYARHLGVKITGPYCLV